MREQYCRIVCFYHIFVKQHKTNTMPPFRKIINLLDQLLTIPGVELNLRTLRFSDEMERKYKRDTYASNRAVMRILLISGVILYAIFALLDYLVLEDFTLSLFIIRFAIVIPILLIVLALTYTPLFVRWGQALLGFSVIIAALGIIAMTVIMPPLGRSLYYSGLLLILFYNYIIRVRFVLATVLGWSILMFYILSFLVFPGIQLKVLWNNLFFLAAINLIGMLAAYSIEYFMRKNYAFSLELDNQRKSVLEMNIHLEDRVREKTIELSNDIERRKIVEKELITAKEKAEESERLKTAFLNNMSHEVRTPMNGILGFADMLALVDPHSPKFNKYLSVLKLSANRLMSTVDDLIAISKVQTGQVDLVFSLFNLKDLLEDLVGSFQSKASNKGLNLSYMRCQEGEINIYSDYTKIKFIISSFIKNAITFTEEGNINLKCQILDNGEILIDVKDTGIGIPKERQLAIFNRFEKSDVQDIEAHQGTGLGLTLSLAYAAKLNGEILVNSKPKEGSTFSLKLPTSIVKNN